MAFAEDLSVFFDPDEFAEEVVIDGAQRVNGIFDEAYEDALGMAASGPMFRCASADVGGVRNEARFERRVNGCEVPYRVVGIEPDGTGVTVLRLVKG